jgi:soluble lytic murein transglycosylase
VQASSNISGQERRNWAKPFPRLVFLSLLLVLCAEITATSSFPKRLPIILPRLAQQYPSPVAETLEALKTGVDHYQKESYVSALENLPGDREEKTTALGDYILLYRAKSHLMLSHDEDALKTFRLLKSRYPDSPLLGEAILGECQALLKLHNPEAVLSVLHGTGLETGPETLYYQARALDVTGQHDKAVELYLQIYSKYVQSELSSAAADYLLKLSPKILSGARNYSSRLQRAENLIRNNQTQEADKLLKTIGKLTAPDSVSKEKWDLLSADVERRQGRVTKALIHLRKVTQKNPSLQQKAIYLEGLCYRKLDREQALIAARDKLLQLYPRSSSTEELLYSIATYYDVNYKPEKTREAYRVLYDKFPKGRYAQRSLWKLALFSYVESDFGQAATTYWNYLLENPSPSSAIAAMYWLGRCYEKLGDFGHARYLYSRIRFMNSINYYGQLSLQAETSLNKSGVGDGYPFSGIDFNMVEKACSVIQVSPVSIAEPSGNAAQIIERARQLAAAGLPDLALSELRWGINKYPQDDKVLYCMTARIYESKADFNGVISSLRRVFVDYDLRPFESLPDEVWRLLYPMQFRALISTYSAQNKTDASLILGLIRQESGFDEQAHSPANAIGLMQILPSTGRKLARQAGISRFNAKKLYQADVNIALGTLHTFNLLQLYGREELALAAYNAGSSRVDRWLQEYRQGDMAEFVEQIPFNETRSYVKQVLSNKARYNLLSFSVVSEEK